MTATRSAIQIPLRKTVSLCALGWIAGVLFSGTAHAKLEDIEAAQSKARNTFIQRFGEFTGDKNVMGRAKTPDGGQAKAGGKPRFNSDDQGPFQSDLTYHDFMYETPDEAFNKANTANASTGGVTKARLLFAGVSDHGAISGAGGSSILERTVYGLHDKFAKQEDDAERKKANEQKGISYRGMFKLDTQEVENKAKKRGEDDVPEKVERWTIREEARPDVEKIGKDSFDTIERAAKTENKEDPQQMGTLSFYYDAANRALNQLWNNLATNLGQRRTYKGVDPQSFGKNVKLSEDTPNCDAWTQKAIGEIDPQATDRDKQVESIQKMAGQCRQMVSTSYSQINPRFETPENGPPDAEPQLTQKGPEKEDPRERDLRVNLEVLGKVGKRAAEVPSNWKYSDQDEKAKIKQYDQSGNEVGEAELRMDESVTKYNQDLDESAATLGEIRNRYPDLKMQEKEILDNKIPLNERSAMEITKFPEQAAYEGFETPIKGNDSPPPQSYEELLQQGAARQ